LTCFPPAWETKNIPPDLTMLGLVSMQNIHQAGP
jgi:hypothetical protein